MEHFCVLHSKFEENKMKGITMNDVKLFKSTQSSAIQGNANAQFRLGVMYTFGDNVNADITEAVKWYQMASKSGHSDAMFNLAVTYADVFGNLVEGFNWFLKAAIQGHLEAQFSVGVMYANGEGVAIDENCAVKWYRISAEKGHAQAQFNLGVAYQKGKGEQIFVI